MFYAVGFGYSKSNRFARYLLQNISGEHVEVEDFLSIDVKKNKNKLIISVFERICHVKNKNKFKETRLHRANAKFGVMRINTKLRHKI